jgi:hypothetical protein
MQHNLTDLLGGADFNSGSNYSFEPDRFNLENSSISLNHGYLKLPPGVYFSGDFTFTAW